MKKYFFIVLPLRKTKNSKCYIWNKQKNNLNVGEKTDQLGMAGPSEHQGGNFPGFLTASYIPDLVPEKLATQNHWKAQK